MELVTLDSEVYKSLNDKLDAINKRLDAKEKTPTEIWYDNQEVLQLLHISKRLLQSWRDEGKIPFSQIGNKIYYRLSDIEELLKAHYSKAFKKVG